MFTTLRTLFGVGGFLLKEQSNCRKFSRLPSPEKENTSFPTVRSFCVMTMKKTGARIIYHGLENLPEEGAFYMVANHLSLFDPLLILSVMDRTTGVVAKKELEHIPFVSAWMRNVSCQFIDRADIRQSLTIIQNTAELLEKGLNMLIFPEGTRSRGEEHEFRKGAVKPAFMAGVPIVPIYIEGSDKLFEANRGLKLTSAEVHLYFGKPVETASMSRTDQKEFAASLKTLILSQKELVV